MNLYRVEMSRAGDVFYVAAKDETTAARAANKQWETWDYLRGVAAIKVELVGWGGQYPPKGNLAGKAVDWFIAAGR